MQNLVGSFKIHLKIIAFLELRESTQSTSKDHIKIKGGSLFIISVENFFGKNP